MLIYIHCYKDFQVIFNLAAKIKLRRHNNTYFMFLQLIKHFDFCERKK